MKHWIKLLENLGKSDYDQGKRKFFILNQTTIQNKGLKIYFQSQK